MNKYETLNSKLNALKALIGFLCPNSISSDIEYIKGHIYDIQAYSNKAKTINIFRELEGLYFDDEKRDIQGLISRLKKDIDYLSERWTQYYNEDTFERAHHEAMLYDDIDLKSIIYQTDGLLKNLSQEIDNFHETYYPLHYMNMKPDDFYEYCLRERITDIEIYNYIENLTSGFGQIKTNLFFTDFCSYYRGQLMITFHQEFHHDSDYWEYSDNQLMPQIESYLDTGNIEIFDSRAGSAIGGLKGLHKVLNLMIGTIRSNGGTQCQIDYNSLLGDLNSYLTGDSGTLQSIIEHKATNGTKMQWIGALTEAVVFADCCGLSIAQFNKCFALKDDRTLKEANRSKKTRDSHTIYPILAKHLNK